MNKMTSKERMLTVLAKQQPDRVPVNYDGNLDINTRLLKHFGLAADDYEGLLRCLGTDIRGIYPGYAGPKLFEDIPGISVDDWGIRRRWVENDSGGYWDYCDWPLADASVEEIAAWPMPNPDDYDYSNIKDICERNKEFAICVGGAGLACIINTNGFFRTMEQTLVDLITDDPAGLLLCDRRQDIELEVTRRAIEAADGGIDFMWIGEDLGTQNSPFIGMDLYRRHIRPRHQRYVDLAKSFDLPIICHTCGSSSWAYEDFIEMGIDAVDTLQPEAANMSPEYLKKHFGGRLAFHGCISTAGPLAYGTADDVREEVKRTLEIMMPGGGYALAPTHSVQDNTPTENVLAMFEAAREHGQY